MWSPRVGLGTAMVPYCLWERVEIEESYSERNLGVRITFEP